MIIRRYRGKSLEALRETVVKEMGANAVIVHSQKLNDNGLVGKFKGKSFEIIAAVEDPVNEGTFSTGKDINWDSFLNDNKSQYIGMRRSMKMMDDKLASIETKFESIMKKSIKETIVPHALVNVHKGWHGKIINRVEDPETTSHEDYKDLLSQLIPTAGGIYFRQTTGNAPDIYALVGPTGVGKTTTLAKLASQAVLKNKLNVGLISIDTFRVAAIDQLREYANLLGIEIAAVFSKKEMERQIEKFKDKDLILIDTQGRGPFDQEGIREIETIINSIPEINVILNVPAGVRKDDAVKIFNSFKSVDPSCIIITKADETRTCDGLTTLFDLADIPAVYITNGQRVPEDIEPASSGLITAMIVPEEVMI
ncbi:MAG: hypothetical protein NE328_09605 [Lentisphaeraceae bacterium]|nr:hypothetical protein [Lentisphaeraceae bacterium]